jgi:hypothetical protein
VSLRHATEKSRQSSAAAAYLIASANVARNHVRSSGDRSETRRSPSLRREHNRSLSRQRPELSASGSTQHGDWRSTSLGVRVSVSVDSSDLPSGCQRAECGNRELVPHVRVIHARYRYRWRQHRSQEMSVRALRRVVHQDVANAAEDALCGFFSAGMTYQRPSSSFNSFQSILYT